MKNKISIIAGVQVPNRGLGLAGDLLHKVDADMKRFKDLTEGHVVIMGRKTWESIPAKFRPLPNRQNIVLTRDANYTAPGAIVCSSLKEGIHQCKKNDAQIFLIGGAHVYQEGLYYANRLYLTEFFGNKSADTFFPEYADFGKEVSREKFVDEKSGVKFDFVEVLKN